MWRWLAIALFLWAGAAHAQSSGEFVGYTYPSTAGNARCSPVCTGASVALNIPTFSGSSINYVFLGILTNAVSGDGTICTGPCVGQFGICFGCAGTGGMHAWYELFCTIGGTGCNSPQPISGITVAVGDTVKLTMVCTANCTGASNETWAVTITDETTNTTCFVQPSSASGHCGSSGVTFTWPLSNLNDVFYVYETDNILTWTPAGRWSEATYTTGLPGSQVVHNTPLSPAMASWVVGSGAGAGKTSSPSGPIGVNGNDFTICAPITSAVFNPCSASPYSASIMGP